MNQPIQPIIENGGKVLSVSFDTTTTTTTATDDTIPVLAVGGVNNHDSSSFSFSSSTSTPRRVHHHCRHQFHAAWLWHNDSRNIMIPSGQKKRSASSWWNDDKPMIVEASVHPAVGCIGLWKKDANNNNNNDDDVSLSSFLVPRGSIHPINMVVTKTTTTATTKTMDNCKSSTDTQSQNTVPLSLSLSEYVLVITWNTPNKSSSSSMNSRRQSEQDAQQQQEENGSSSSSSSGCTTTTSIYNMQWLKDWSYYTDSNDDDDEDHHHRVLYHSARIRREVSTKHTFIHSNKQVLESKGIEKRRVGDGTLDEMNHGGLKCVDYHDLLAVHVNDSTTTSTSVIDKKILPFMDALFLQGAVMIQNAPHDGIHDSPEDVIEHIAKVISGHNAGLSHGSLYGNTFHVQSTRDAINVAYTSQELCPHQDLAYYESKPGFQLLFCVSMPANIIGGESILIDCMAAAHEFRKIAPDLFEILVKCSACFVKDRQGARMTYARPHIVLHTDGTTSDLNNIHREIVSVHWSPPFEGPMPTLPPDLLEGYLKAYAAFELMLDNTKCPITCSEATGIDLDLAVELAAYGKEYTWQKLLKPGEILVFNNTRMLHGRRKFEMPRYTVEKEKEQETTTTAMMLERHLVGGYTNIDDSLNRYRTLLKELNVHRTMPNMGNGTISVLP